MAGTCSVTAYCKNSKGEIVESKLFNDLLHYLPSRDVAKEYYGVGTSKEFLDKVSDKAKFDENGEITFGSLKKLAKINLNKERTLEILNKEVKAGNYSYNDAIGNLISFNRNSGLNGEFMATLTDNQDGTYHLSVVERNEANEQKLSKIISNQTLQDRIKYYLNSKGVGVEFMERDEKINGRYSTKNAVKTADGMYQLIQVANGKKLTGSLAEEAGHFAIGALGDSPLVTRLLNTLTPEVQREIIGDEYDSKYLSDSAKREIAGTLVGKAIEGEIDKRAPWQNLAHRILEKAKRIFYTMKSDEIAKAKLDAIKLAEQIARNFMSDGFEGTVENALETKETLYNAPTSFNVKIFKQTVNRLKLQAEEMKVINRDLYDKYINIVGQVESGRDVDSPGTFADSIALEGITEAVALMADLMTAEIPDLLASVKFDDISDFAMNMPRNAQSLRVVRTYIRTLTALSRIITDAAKSVGGTNSLVGDTRRVTVVDSKTKDRVTYNLLGMLDSINDILQNKEGNGIVSSLANKENAFFLKFLEQIHGSSFIKRATRVLFSNKAQRRAGKGLLHFEEGQEVSLEDLMTTLETDITPFERWLASMSNNSDVVGQIADKAVKAANKWADTLAYKYQDRLRVLKAKMENAGYKNTDLFCEKSNRIPQGLTGNIVSEVCWGDWENDWLQFKKEKQEQFKADHPNLDSLSDFEKGVLWGEFFKPLAKEWHKGSATSPAHSRYDKTQNMWVPNNNASKGKNYTSHQYEDLLYKHPDAIQFLNEFNDIKRELGSLLPEGSMPHHRLPQFKGTVSNKIRNKKLLNNSRLRSTKQTLLNELAETFCESSEDTDYGSDLTYNSISEDMFGNQLAFEKEKLNRVPLFGINKLKDPTQMSTDLYHSFFAFAGMACQYAAMSQVVDTLEVGRDVLLRRNVKGMKEEEEGVRRDGGASNAFNRYIKFLDKQVYGIGVPKIKFGKKIVLNKVAGFLSSLASKRFLWGNVAGGMVNAGTGTIEVFKEAYAGEYYTLKDWKAAHNMYFGFKDKDGYHLPCCLSNWGNAGKDIKQDKVSMFVRHFNATSDNKKFQREWHTRDKRIENFFGNSLWLPYKSGDHYMQTISYLALANATKLYDLYGNEISLYDAYDVEALEDENGFKSTKFGKSLKLNEEYFKTAEGGQEYYKIKNIVDQLDAVLNNSSSPLGTVLQLSQDEIDYVNSLGLNLADMKATRTILAEKMDSHIWGVEDESAFMDKAREINNRLHGIYNNQDKVAFQQNIYGNMVLAMRGYALGMLERRFGTSKYSEVLGGENEGTIRTFAKVVASTFTDKGGFKSTMRAIFLPTGEKTKQSMMAMGFSANQYYNMRRNLADMLFILALTILKAITAKGGDDDDDDEEDDDQGSGILYYFSTRLLREQSAFNTIWGAKDEMGNLLSAAPIGFSALTDITNMTYLILGENFASKEDATFYYKSRKEGAYEIGDSKGWNKFWRTFPYLRSLYTFSHPYDAAKSFEYGRKIRN